MRRALLLLLAGAVAAAEPGFKEIFDPLDSGFPVDGSRTKLKQDAFERAVAKSGVAKAPRHFRGFEKGLEALDQRLLRDWDVYGKVSEAYWGWRRKLEEEHLKKHGRMPAEYPVPPALNDDFIAKEKQFRQTRSVKLRERLFQEWAVERTAELVRALDGKDREKAVGAVAAELRQRNPHQRLRACAILRALGATAEIDAAVGREKHPAVLAALLAGASWEAAAPFLGHAEGQVVAGAVRAALRVRSRAAVESLVALQPEGRLSDDVAAALRDLTGEDGGWREWWEGVGPAWAPAPAPPTESDPEACPGIPSDGPVELFDVRTSSRAVVFCVEASLPDAWAMVRERLTAAVRLLPEGARFGVVVFATEARAFKKGLVEADEASRKALASFLDKVEAGGGADLHAALDLALDLGGDTLFVTAFSGPRSGLYEDPRQVALEINARNALLGVRIHTFGRSGGAESYYLQSLSRPFAGTHR